MGLETIAALLQSLTTTVNGLTKRLDALEQSQGTNNSAKNPGQDPGTDQPDTKGETPANQDQEQNSKAAKKLRLVEFRERIYQDDSLKFEWKNIDADEDQKTSSDKPSFRYDTDENGKIAFLVYRSAKIFRWLLKACPPAADGQVNLLAEGLVFEDAFPLLHLGPELDEYEKTFDNDKTENAHHDRILEELRVLKKLYDREGHFKEAKRQYDRIHRTKQIDFSSLRGLFRRDQLVVFRELRDELAVARVTMITAIDENDRYGRDVGVFLDCKAIDFDGKKFRYHLYEKTIEVFTGSRNITELEVYPLEYSHEREEIIQKSIDSGKKWWKLHERLTDAAGESRAAVMHYSGYCETFGQDARDETAGKGSQVQRTPTNAPTVLILVADAPGSS